MTERFENLRRRWRELFRKRRFCMLNATDNSEEWHIHLSPASAFAATVAFVLLLFILTLSLVAYSPVLEMLPGYRTAADHSRESLAHNIMRLDSMERMISDMMTYNENISLILEGRTPVVRTIDPSRDSLHATKVLVVPSAEDSLLRAQMEGDGPYALSGRTDTRRSVREALDLTRPIEGIVTDRFDLGAGRFGIRIAAAAAERVAAIDKGTVVQSLWTPESGCTVIIQHADNLLSVYRGLSQTLAQTGQSVKRGDLVGYNAEAAGGEVRLFEFELWSNGKPVDPEGYILF